MTLVAMRLEGPARRIAIAIAVLILVMAAAIIITIVKYGDSRSADNTAIAEGQTALYAQQLRTAITDEGGIVDGYAGDGNPADLKDLAGRHRDFRTALRLLRTSPG